MLYQNKIGKEAVSAPPRSTHTAAAREKTPYQVARVNLPCEISRVETRVSEDLRLALDLYPKDPRIRTPREHDEILITVQTSI